MLNRKLFIAATALLLNHYAIAADEGGAQKALAKAQFLLRQVTAEKTDLQTQVSTLQQQIDKLTKEIATTKSGVATEKQKSEQRYGEAVAQCRNLGEKTSEQSAQLRTQLKKEAEQRGQVEAAYKTQQENLEHCVDNNHKLYGFNKELIARYNDKGFIDTLKQREPFTGVKQVEMENLLQDFENKNDDLKINSVNISSNKPGGEVAAP